MKIAVLFFGQPRTLELCAKHIRRNFTYEGVQTDFFVHSFDRVNFIGSEDLGVERKFDIDELKDLYVKYYNPVDMIVEDYSALTEICKAIHKTQRIVMGRSKKRDEPPSYYGMINKSEYSFVKFLSQFYSSQAVNDLKKKHEEDNNFKYDVVIKSRTDSVFLLTDERKRRSIFLDDYQSKNGVLDIIWTPHLRVREGNVMLCDQVIWGPSASFDMWLDNIVYSCVELVQKLSSEFFYDTGLNKYASPPEHFYAYAAIKKGMSIYQKQCPFATAREGLTSIDCYQDVHNFNVDAMTANLKGMTDDERREKYKKILGVE